MEGTLIVAGLFKEEKDAFTLSHACKTWRPLLRPARLFRPCANVPFRRAARALARGAGLFLPRAPLPDDAAQRELAAALR